MGEDIETVVRGRGCAKCNNTGYRGRIAVHEIFSVDAMLRRMISSRASMEEIEENAREHQGMRTLKESGVRLVKEGVTTIEELLKIAY